MARQICKDQAAEMLRLAKEADVSAKAADQNTELPP